MTRQAIIIKEKKRRIANVKKKFSNPEMSNEVASKIIRLEITNNILKAATAVVGVGMIIDVFTPDSTPFIDEIAMSALGGLLAGTVSMIDNKIEDIAMSEAPSEQMEEFTTLTEQLSIIENNIKETKKNR